MGLLKCPNQTGILSIDSEINLHSGQFVGAANRNLNDYPVNMMLLYPPFLCSLGEE